MNEIQRWEAGGSPATRGDAPGSATTIRRHTGHGLGDDNDIGQVGQVEDLRDTLSPAVMDAFVDAVVERIERRVVEELERRGRHQNWRAF